MISFIANLGIGFLDMRWVLIKAKNSIDIDYMNPKISDRMFVGIPKNLRF